MTTTPEPHITDKLRSDAITVLSAWPAPNPRQEGLRHRYLRYLSEHRDAMWRSCSPDHLTASALIVSADRRHVLLTLHARAKRWLQTGGHCEAGDDTLAAAAIREAREESGIDALTIGSTPVLLSRHAVPFCGPAAHHLDVQYCAIAPVGAEIRVSSESDDVRWWPAVSLPEDADAAVRDLVAACTR